MGDSSKSVVLKLVSRECSGVYAMDDLFLEKHPVKNEAILPPSSMPKSRLSRRESSVWKQGLLERTGEHP